MVGAFGQVPITDYLIGTMARGERRAQIYGARYVMTFLVRRRRYPDDLLRVRELGFDRLFQIMSGGAGASPSSPRSSCRDASRRRRRWRAGQGGVTSAPVASFAQIQFTRATRLARNIMPAPRTIIVTGAASGIALPAWKPCWRRATMCAASTETP